MSSSSIRAHLALVALLSATTFYFAYKSRRLNKFLRHSDYRKKPENPNPNKGKLFFISQTGTSKTLAKRLHALLTSNDLLFDLVDPQTYEPEDLSKEALVLIVASSWEDGKPPEAAKFFMNWIDESANDFRVGSLLLSNCKFAVFGVGSKSYEKTFNMVAKDLSKKMRELGAGEVLPVVEGDVDGGELDVVFEDWSKRVVAILKSCGDRLENGIVNGEASIVGVESDPVYHEYDDDEEEEDVVESEMVDLEDIAGKGPSRRSVNVADTNGKVKDGKRDMVTPVIRASLEKQVSSC